MSKRRRWVVMAALFLAAIAISMSQYKVPPVMPVLMRVFGLDLAMANLPMSVFSLSALLLAPVAGIMVHRIGLKQAALLALGATVVGSGLGALSGWSSALPASRTVEDFSFILT